MAERGIAQRVLEALRAAIASGELQESEKLPSATELMREFRISRTTADRVLHTLRSEGLAVSRPGAGVFVRPFMTIKRDANARLGRSHWGAGRSIQDSDTGARTRAVHVNVAVVPAPSLVSTALGLPADTGVVARSRRFYVDDRAVQLSTSYIPADLAAAAGLLDEDTGPGGMYARLADAGRGPVRFVEQIRGRMPTADEVQMLELPLGTPVFAISRTAFDADDQVVEVNEMVLDAAVYELRYEIRA